MDPAILKAFLTLGGSVAVIAVLFYALKKYALKIKSAANTIDLQILSKLSLQPKNHLFVVKAGNKTLLLGVSEKEVNILSDLTDEYQPKAAKEIIKKNKQLQNLDKIEDLENNLSFKTFLKNAIGMN